MERKAGKALILSLRTNDTRGIEPSYDIKRPLKVF